MPPAPKTKSQSKCQCKAKIRSCSVHSSTDNDQLTAVNPTYALGFGPQPRIPLQRIEETVFWCSTCNTTIKNLGDRSRHWRNIHTNVEEFVGCPFCDLKFERVLHNLIKHIAGHFVEHPMRCTERLPSSDRCPKTFTSPKEWDEHREKVHQRNYHSYLYTEKGAIRNLRASHDDKIFNVVYNDFRQGCPKVLSDCIDPRKAPPIEGAVLLFSPAGMPYFSVNIEWKDLLDPTLRAKMIRIQTSMGHRFCLDELLAIDRCFSPVASSSSASSCVPSSSASPSDRYSPSPPLLSTPPSPMTTPSSSTSSAASQLMYPQDLYNHSASSMRYPPFPSSAYGQSLVMPSPQAPSHQIEERCDFIHHRYGPYTMAHHSSFRTPALVSSGFIEAFTSSPRYNPILTAARFPSRSPSLSPSPSLPPSLTYSSSPPSPPPHLDYEESAARHLPCYRGYTRKMVSRTTLPKDPRHR
ncbi:hypothetical protein QCA50_007518 [Cerrena zonata]|uniref:C2H2-type domain-containing protein n=1 Tax=Cerrena zonata TaxID=2478898 RepID=A0AAW0GB23_9APHY